MAADSLIRDDQVPILVAYEYGVTSGVLPLHEALQKAFDAGRIKGQEEGLKRACEIIKAPA